MRPRLDMLYLGGFMGTLVITVITYMVSPLLIGPPVDFAAALAGLIGGGRTVDLIAHFAIGTFVLPTLFALFFYPWLKGSALVRALSWGVIVWLLTQITIVPLGGGGLFSAHAGGVLAASGSLAEHLLYGFSLGIFAPGPEQDTRHVAEPRRHGPYMRRAS